eukprot:scaffold17181_cov61-Phaeocystis_antarctica.AAC.1
MADRVTRLKGASTEPTIARLSLINTPRSSHFKQTEKRVDSRSGGGKARVRLRAAAPQAKPLYGYGA